jgi:hypothetical protein
LDRAGVLENLFDLSWLLCSSATSRCPDSSTILRRTREGASTTFHPRGRLVRIPEAVLRKLDLQLPAIEAWVDGKNLITTLMLAQGVG